MQKKKRADFQCKRLAWRWILTDEVIRSNKTALSKTDTSTEAARGWVRLQASRCNLTRFDWLLHQTFSIFPTFPVLPWLLVPGSFTRGLHSGEITCSANVFRAFTQASRIRSAQLFTCSRTAPSMKDSSQAVISALTSSTPQLSSAAESRTIQGSTAP